MLLPSAPGSVVLVATQQSLGELVQDGARMIPVHPLDGAAAASLLRSVCGASRIDQELPAAEAVARLCGGHTDALRVAGARLVLDPALGVAELAEELADEARRLEPLSLPGWASTGVDSTVAAATVTQRPASAPTGTRTSRSAPTAPPLGHVTTVTNRRGSPRQRP